MEVVDEGEDLFRWGLDGGGAFDAQGAGRVVA